MKITIIFLLSALSLSLLSGDSSNIQTAFIDNMIGARAQSMGGAYKGIVDTPDALLWNPSGLSDQNNKHAIIFEYLELKNIFSYNFTAYGYSVNDRCFLGVGMFYSGDEAMSETVLYSGAAYSFLKRENHYLISSGLTLKYLMSRYGNNSNGSLFDDLGQNHQISGSASGFSIDAGLKVRITERDIFAATTKNVFDRVIWSSKNEAGTAGGNYRENLPFAWTLGYTRIQDKLIISTDITKAVRNDVEDILQIGIEYNLRPYFAVRGGYGQELVTADNKRLSIGTGIGVDTILPFKMSFAYIYNIEFENSFLFSLSMF